MEDKIMTDTNKKANIKEQPKKKFNKTWQAILDHQGDIKVVESGLFL